MRTVWKHILQIGETTTIGATLCPSVNHVGVDPAGGGLAVWVDHYTETPPLVLFAPVVMKFHVVGTGWEVPDRARHVGSVVAGQFVWHVYAEWTAS